MKLRLNKTQAAELNARGRVEVERNGFTIIVERAPQNPGDYKIYVANPYDGVLS